MINLLTIFIPAYNEEDNLTRCIHALVPVLEKSGAPFELLIVDDASLDQTRAVAEHLAAQDNRIKVRCHSQNLGMGGGFCTAVEHAQGDWLILIPADLAMNLDDLHKYMEAALRADVVVGLCSSRDDYSLFRKLVSWVNIHLIQLLFGMKESQFQYISMYRMEVLRRVKVEYWHSAFFMAEVLIKAKALGFHLVEVKIRYIPREAGKATGTHGAAIFKAVRDMLHFWLRWKLLGIKVFARDNT